MNDLFSSGKIYLIKKPISGRYGLPKIMGNLLTGAFGEDIASADEEIYVVLTTKDRKTLIIFHMDDLGYDLTKRRLFHGKFALILDNDDESNPVKITREELKRLVLDGTFAGDWHSPQLKSMFENFMSAQPIPAL